MAITISGDTPNFSAATITTLTSTTGTVTTLTSTTLSDGTNSTSTTNAIQGSAKAWVSFTGSTAAIRGSYNVSSVTRASAGSFTINFTNALTDANYAITGSAGSGGTTGGYMICNYQLAPTSSACTVLTLNTGSTATDYAYTSVIILR